MDERAGMTEQPEAAPVKCACGAVLLDGKDDRTVVLGEERIQFRRTTDYVACSECGSLYAVRDLLAGHQARKENTDPLQELSALQGAAAGPALDELGEWTADLEIDDADVEDLTLDDFRLK